MRHIYRVRSPQRVRPLLIALGTVGLLLGCGSSGHAEEPGDVARYRTAVARALRLLPRQPQEVVVVDTDAALDDPKDTRHILGFVTSDSRAVYLVRQGYILQKALQGPGPCDYVLATIIWHEMAHLDGADEVPAQLEEEKLWVLFVTTRRVESHTGLRYLALLKKRR